jgi:hypothetical protein
MSATFRVGSQPADRFAGDAFVSKDGPAVVFQLPKKRCEKCFGQIV